MKKFLINWLKVVLACICFVVVGASGVSFFYGMITYPKIFLPIAFLGFTVFMTIIKQAMD